MTSDEKRLEKLESEIREFNAVVSGAGLQGGFPELEKRATVEERIAQIKLAHEKFSVQGNDLATVEGNLKKGVAINFKCPDRSDEVGPIPPPPPISPCPSADNVQLTFSGVDLFCGCVDVHTALGPNSILVTDDFGINDVFTLPKVFENADQIMYELVFADGAALYQFDFWSVVTDCSDVSDGNGIPDMNMRLICLKHDDDPFSAGVYVETIAGGGRRVLFFGYDPSASSISNVVTCGGCPSPDWYSCPGGQNHGIAQDGSVDWIEL